MMDEGAETPPESGDAFHAIIPGRYFLRDNLVVPTGLRVFSHKSLKLLARPKGGKSKAPNGKITIATE
jgi:hypothetical protein